MLPGTDAVSYRMSLESAIAERDKMQTDLGAQEGQTRSLQQQLTIVTEELTEKSDFASSVSTTMVLQLADQRYELAVAKLTVVKWRYVCSQAGSPAFMLVWQILGWVAEQSDCPDFPQLSDRKEGPSRS